MRHKISICLSLLVTTLLQSQSKTLEFKTDKTLIVHTFLEHGGVY